MARLEAERAAAGTQMSSLPEECVREILLRLSDADDLDRAGTFSINTGNSVTSYS